MSLVINASAVSWGIVGTTLCQISYCSVRLNSIVRQRQLHLYGHVARYPEADPGRVPTKILSNAKYT